MRFWVRLISLIARVLEGMTRLTSQFQCPRRIEAWEGEVRRDPAVWCLWSRIWSTHWHYYQDKRMRLIPWGSAWNRCCSNSRRRHERRFSPTCADASAHVDASVRTTTSSSRSCPAAPQQPRCFRCAKCPTAENKTFKDQFKRREGCALPLSPLGMRGAVLPRDDGDLCSENSLNAVHGLGK
jgi:hypothetical protein